MNAERRNSGGSRHAEKSLPYHSFIVRCWQERDASAGEQPIWRFSLLEVGSQEPRHAFANLATLFRYVAARTGGSEPEDVEREDAKT